MSLRYSLHVTFDAAGVCVGEEGDVEDEDSTAVMRYMIRFTSQ